MDSKSDREYYDSRKTLQATIRELLSDTDWRLTNEGISYRLGYLTGELRAYEDEGDLKKLVIKSGIKPKKLHKEGSRGNSYYIKGETVRILFYNH